MGKRRKRGWLIYNAKAPRRLGRYWDRLDRVKDPKTAFMYLLDNVSSQNSGKLLHERASRGDYYWQERSRGADQCYFLVRKKGNRVVVTRRRFVVDGEGVNTFLGSLLGFEKEPVVEDTIVLQHPIMDVTTFRAAYAAATPELGHWDD